jgi:hypothetical protein
VISLAFSLILVPALMRLLARERHGAPAPAPAAA